MKRPFSELLSDYLQGTLPPAEMEEFFSQVAANRALLVEVIDGKAAAERPLPENKERTERMLLRLGTVLDQMEEPAALMNGAAVPATGTHITANSFADTATGTHIEAQPFAQKPGAEAPVPDISDTHRIPFLRRWGWVAAAALLLLAAGTYLWRSPDKKNQPPAALVAKTVDIIPGHKGAILTLSNGTQVVLDSLDNGVIAQQAGAKVLLRNGRLAYNPTGEKATAIAYNTMTTPRGRQFQLTLPDGTRVWLNAASSIRYPTAFEGTERKVEITGEAYFEVARNTGQPFRVNVDNRADIEVLGTHFNVNAYENEKTLNTTLLEGSVRVSAGNPQQSQEAGQQQSATQQQTGRQPARQAAAVTENAVVLRPGQQAQLRNRLTVINDKDIDKVMAWKNGAFNFEDLPLEEAMHQLERWYDIKVTYESGIPNVRFGGKIGQDVRLADLLQMLAGTKLKFRMEKGRELVIMK